MLQFNEESLSKLDENDIILMELILHEGFKSVCGKICNANVFCTNCAMRSICDTKDALTWQLDAALEKVRTDAQQ